MNRSAPPSAGAAAARTAETATTTRPATTTRTLPNRSVSRPEKRRQREHPERVRRDDQADGRQPVAVHRHVERRHRHDQDHHDLDRDERDDRDRHVRRRRIRSSDVPVEVGTSSSCAEWSASAYGSGRSIVNDRIAAAPTKMIKRRRRVRREPDALAGHLANPIRFGPTTAPNVAPHTTMPIADAAGDRVQVGKGVARQLVGAVAEADQRGPRGWLGSASTTARSRSPRRRRR